MILSTPRLRTAALIAMLLVLCLALVACTDTKTAVVTDAGHSYSFYDSQTYGYQSAIYVRDLKTGEQLTALVPNGIAEPQVGDQVSYSDPTPSDGLVEVNQIVKVASP